MSITPAQLRRSFGPIYRYLSRCGSDMDCDTRMVLVNLLERLGQSSSANPKQETIAADLGVSLKTVRRCLSTLQERGFLDSQRRGLGKANQYSLNVEALVSWAERGLSRRGRKGTSDRARTALPDRVETAHQEGAQTALPIEKNHQGRATIEDPPVKNVLGAWEQETAGTLSRMDYENIAEDVEHFGELRVLAAMKRSVAAGKRTYNYVHGILRTWEREGFPDDRREKRDDRVEHSPFAAYGS